MKILLGTAFVSLVVALMAASCEPLERTYLEQRQLETPSFQQAPAGPSLSEMTAAVMRDLSGEPGREVLSRLVPSQASALWLATVILIVVGLDLTRPWHSRNIELLALLPVGFLLFDVMRFFEFLQDPIYFRVFDWVFIGIMTVSVGLLGAALWRMKAPHAEPWRPRLDPTTLMVLTIFLLALNVGSALVREPDDVGFYSNLGAQRLRERGMFPYGDPLLTNTPGATYSPILYYVHMAYQILLAPIPLNGPEPRPAFGTYVLPPIEASQLATITFHLAGVIGLFIAGRRILGQAGAWGVTALYCGSVYVMGVGGEREMIGGMTFASHIAPAAVTMLAFAAVPRPAWSGVLLATAMATLFYPAFMFPAWLGYYWRSAADARRFVAGFVLASLIIGVPVLLRSERIEGRGMISTILHETQGHQQDPKAYGSSPFGFWGLRDGVRAMFRDPVIEGQPNTSPAFLLFAAFVVGSFFIARGRSEVQLALLTGALAIASQLWKIHGTGVYVTWYYGFLLLGFLGHAAGRSRSATGGSAMVEDRTEK